MRIRAGFEIAYDCPEPVPMILQLSVHPKRRGDLETPDRVQTQPRTDLVQYIDDFGNICSRVLAPRGRFVLSADFTIRDTGLVDDYAPDAIQIPVQDLPAETLVFLLGSRYCETDKLSEVAWSLFGSTPRGWPRVQAIVDYVHDYIAYGYEYARSTKSAYDVFGERTGVCRDYAHLAITFCRCMGIPARYCTGYLGDIGVPVAGVMDFSAWFEAYLGGRWYTFDARNHIPRTGRILVAQGRDATDAAISTAFGTALLASFRVITEERAACGAAGGAARSL
jgi:transglutaminase-like putative cysteine protease